VYENKVIKENEYGRLVERTISEGETEYRFNHRGQDLYKILLRIFRKNPL